MKQSSAGETCSIPFQFELSNHTSSTLGTTVNFVPSVATDDMRKNGTKQTVNTKHMSITAMKQYESKSVEELRNEDYAVNRKEPQPGEKWSFGQSTSSLFPSSGKSTQSSSLFGIPQTVPSATFSFGQSKPPFGSTSRQPFDFGGALFPTAGKSAETAGLFAGSKGTGTIVKFDAPVSADTMLSCGENRTVCTKLICISGMKNYASKSFEELRCEDYSAKRKGHSGKCLPIGPLMKPTPSSLSSFGQKKTPFASPSSNLGSGIASFSSQQSTGNSLFGPKISVFGVSASSTASAFWQRQTNGTSQTGATSSLFGQSKPFFSAAQSSGFTSAVDPPSPLFASQKSTGTLLFGRNESVFGSPASSTTTAFWGTQKNGTSQTVATSSFFGQPKPFFGSAILQDSGFGTTSPPFPVTQPSTQTGNLFGGIFGAPTTAETAIKFQSPTAESCDTKHLSNTTTKPFSCQSAEVNTSLIKELRSEDGAKHLGAQDGEIQLPEQAPFVDRFSFHAGSRKTPFSQEVHEAFKTPSISSLSETQKSAGNLPSRTAKPGPADLQTSATKSSGQIQQTGTWVLGIKPAYLSLLFICLLIVTAFLSFMLGSSIRSHVSEAACEMLPEIIISEVVLEAHVYV